MWSLHTDAGNSIHGGQYAKNVYLGETRIVTKLCLRNDPRADAEELQQYFYHSDHLGSASLISDYKGDEYQRIEYTPYGETWIERTDNKGLAYLPYKFTAKELDSETGLYYYGARYLDSKYSTWISTDPALGDYIPQAPISDEARKHNQNLPGMGGIFNHINCNLYAYGANNPVRYIDPDGRFAKNQELSRTERNLSWNDFASTRDSQKAKQDRRDSARSLLGWAITVISLVGGVVGDVADAASTASGLLSVKPDNLNKLNKALQNISNTAADISQTTGEVPNIEIVEVTTRTATNQDVQGIGGAALVNTMMEHSITEETTLEITINGKKQDPITVSKKQTYITYERSLNYDDFSWAK